MDRPRFAIRRLGRIVTAGLFAMVLAACGGGGGGGEAAPPSLPPTIDTGPAALAASSELNIRVDSASVDHRPAVEFTVTNQAGVGMTGLVAADLRFNIAKLVPGTNGAAEHWQDYINRAQDGVTQGSQERSATGYPA